MAVTQNIANKVFIVNRSELEGRFDTTFYFDKPDYTNCQKLSKYAKVKGGKRIPLGLDYSNTETSYLYLRVADMDENNEFDFSNLKFIDENIFNLLQRYETVYNDIIISIAGTVGKVKLVRNIPTNKRIILTENCAKIVLNGNIEILPEYFTLLFQTNFIKKQIDIGYIQTTIPKLGIDKILNLRIPTIPNKKVQISIVDKFHNAYSQKQQKEAQAKLLLESIDIFLLNELGIALHTKKNTAKDRIFISSFREVVGLRLDPLYFNNIHKTESEIYKNAPLRKITNIKKGQSITKEKITEGDYPVIAGGQTSPYNNGVYNFKGNIITISASGAYSGFVWYHNYPIFASDCNVVQSKDENNVSTEFVYFVLKALQSEIYKLQQGAGQPHVYARDIEKFTIPVPTIKKQKEILKHIKDIQQQIIKLKADATSILENAKAEVEKMILG